MLFPRGKILQRKFFWILSKLFFAGTKVYLTLEDECSKLIRVAPTEGVRFFNSLVPFFGGLLAWLVSTNNKARRSRSAVLEEGLCIELDIKLGNTRGILGTTLSISLSSGNSGSWEARHMLRSWVAVRGHSTGIRVSSLGGGTRCRHVKGIVLSMSQGVKNWTWFGCGLKGSTEIV